MRVDISIGLRRRLSVTTFSVATAAIKSGNIEGNRKSLDQATFCAVLFLFFLLLVPASAVALARLTAM